MRKMRLSWAIVIGIIVIIPILAQAEDYFLLSYGEGNDDTSGLGVYLKRIDLDSAKIVDSVFISNHGTIATEHPIKLSLSDEKYLLAFLDRTLFAKNGWGGGDQVYYKIIKVDSTLSVVKADSFIDCYTSPLGQYEDDNNFIFGIEKYHTFEVILQKGRYTIDTLYHFVLVDSSISNPLYIEELNHFKYLRPVKSSNKHNLYYAEVNDWQLLRLDSTKTKIIDSLNLISGLKVSTIFAYHPKTDKFYCFYLNYECHSKFEDLVKNYGDDWITPIVRIYNPTNFQLIETDTVADFTPGNYPYMADGLADVVGNYIVFYFYDDERLSMIFPAMLFIFDTRTNTARWLNVGWR